MTFSWPMFSAETQLLIHLLAKFGSAPTVAHLCISKGLSGVKMCGCAMAQPQDNTENMASFTHAKDLVKPLKRI